MKSAFEVLQPLGRALMLPIAVLPVAGLLLRLGQPDLWQHLPGVLPYLPFFAAAGQSIFDNLGLLFAAGVAVGLAKENHGAAALAGVVCYIVATTAAKTLMGLPPELATKAIFRLSVPTGIVSGLISGWLYNRYHAIKLPEYLAFFGGRRFVPIVAGFSGLVLAFVIGKSWASISGAMDAVSHGVVGLGGLGLFIYGVLNRLLIVTGLHHILNSLVWFNLGSFHGVTGDLNRFMAGDPSAGAFMAGFFPVMMFGLPAACLAMYHAARPDRRKEIGGMLASMALTAFLTGVTEPIEFSFMFLAPPLYALHAVLTGLSMTLMSALDVHLGFGFSAGFFDYVINFNKAQHPWLLLPVGAAYFAVYYGLFRLAIRVFNLKTLGRDEAPVAASPAIAPSNRGAAWVVALGGAANLKTVDACTTRLRLTVTSNTAIDEAAARALGAKGFVRPSANGLQVVVGPIADQIAGEIRAALSNPEADVSALAAALGGRANIAKLTRCASRLVIDLKNPAAADDAALKSCGVRSVARLKDSLHLIVGPEAEALEVALRN